MFTQILWMVVALVLAWLVELPYKIVRKRIMEGRERRPGWCAFAKGYQMLRLFVVAFGLPILTVVAMRNGHWICGGIALIATLAVYSWFVRNARRHNASVGFYHKHYG